MSLGRVAILLILCTASNVLYSQARDEEDTVTLESPIVQPQRYEFEYKTNDVDYHLVTAEDQGLLVVQETNIRTKEGFTYVLHMLDTALNKIWDKEVVVKFGWTFLGYDYNKSGFYLLFNTAEYSAEKLLVMKIGLDGEEFKSYEFETVVPMDLTHFETVGNGMILGGTARGIPTIVYYGLKEGRPRVLPGIYNNKSRIIAIEPNDEFGVFSVMVSERTASKDFSVTIKVFSGRGEELFSETLNTESEKSLLDAVTTYFRNGTQYVSGTYADRNTDRSIGFYITKLQKGRQEFINYYPYSDLYNFFSYMRDKREKRMKEKIDRKKIRGKNVKLNYRLLVHEIIRRGEEFILIGEAYYPKYENSNAYGSSYYYYDPFTNPGGTRSYADRLLGYQYTHAVVVGFNQDGEVLWDNSFEINDVLLPTLEENIQVNVEKDRIVLLYAFENEIRSRVLRKDDDVEETVVVPIELTFENDEVKKNTEDLQGLKPWYPHNFYAFGTHRVRNSEDQSVKNSRKVFYINKITFD